MAQPKLVKPDKFQIYAEKGLFFAAWLLGVLHMLLAVFRYTIPYGQFRAYIRWFSVFLIFAAGAYLILYRIKYPRTMYRVKALFKSMRNFNQLYVVALFFWFVLICAVRQPIDHVRYFKIHDWWLLDTALSALVLFPMACYAGRENAKKPIEWMLHIVVLSYSVFTGWALWQVFHLNVLTLPSGNQIGMTAQTQLGFGCHYNITGAIAFTMFAVSCYMIVTQKPGIKVIYVIAAALHLLVSLLSNSRTVYVTVLFFCSASVFFGTWYLLRKHKNIYRILISILAVTSCIFVLRWLRTAIFVMFDSVTNFHALLGSSSGSAASAEDDVRELNNLSGRTKIWLAALKIMFSSPIAFFFGVTPAQVTNALKEIGGLTADIAHAHNIVLQVGASMGVPAMIAFVVFVVKITIDGLKIYWNTRGIELRDIGIVPIFIISLLIMNLAEAYLISYYSIMSSVFFLFCGFLTYWKPQSEVVDPT